MFKEQYIKVSDIMRYCEESAKNSRELADKCIRSTGRGESETSSLGGAAYFLQKAAMFEYEIPNIIRCLDYEDFGVTNKPPELIPIEALGLSTRVYNALRRAGMDTLGDITKLYLYQLKKTRNLGGTGLKEVREMLSKHNTHLKGEKTYEI